MSGVLSEALRARIGETAARYARKQAALLPVLHLVQGELGGVPAEAEREVAGLLDLRPIQVREAVTFYSMLRRRPEGRHRVQVCRNLSCGLGGGERLWDALRERLGVEEGGTTPDGRFTLSAVECLGACDQAPCLMVDFELYGSVDPGRIDEILKAWE